MDEPSGSVADEENLDALQVARSKQHSREIEMVGTRPDTPVPSSILHPLPNQCLEIRTKEWCLGFSRSDTGQSLPATFLARGLC